MLRFRSSARVLLTFTLLCSFVPVPIAFSQQKLALSKPLINRWVYETTGTSVYTPAADKELVFVPLLNGELVALWRSNGTLSWRSEIGGDFSASPVSDEARVYIASEIRSKPETAGPASGGLIHSIGTRSGVTLWARNLSGPIRAALTANHVNLFGGSVDGKLYAFRKATGDIAWLKTNTSPFNSQPAVYGDTLYIGDEAGYLLAIEQETGRTLWRYRTRGPLRASPVAANGSVYVGSLDSHVYAFNEKTGKLQWSSRTNTAVQSLVATPRCIIATSLDNFVYCLSPKDGNRIWKRQVAGRILARPLATEDGVLVAPLAGDECLVLDLQDGKKINSINVGEENNTAAGPIQAGGLLFITTRRGLIALSSEKETE
jgi:outer membrane protein assembly factor BamB